jgi:hypothetical protein
LVETEKKGSGTNRFKRSRAYLKAIDKIITIESIQEKS